MTKLKEEKIWPFNIFQIATEKGGSVNLYETTNEIRRIITFLLLSLLLAGLVFVSNVSGQGLYRVVGIESAFPNGSVSPNQISNSGEITGWSADESDRTGAATMWSKTGTVLRTLPMPPGATSSFANGIRSDASAVGHFQIADLNNRLELRPILWMNGLTPIPLPLPSPPGLPPDANLVDVAGTAMAIGDGGHIVGYTNFNYCGTGGCKYQSYPLRWSASTLTAEYLPTLGEGGSATDVNSSGYAIGQVLGTNGIDRGVVWNPDGLIVRLLQSLPGGLDCRANAINNNGDVVGVSSSSSGWRPVLWPAGQVDPVPLPVPSESFGTGAAMDINSAGDIVGFVNSNPEIPVLWKKDLSWVNLNTQISHEGGWTLSSAALINDNGMIIANGSVNEGRTKPIILLRSGPVEMARDLIDAPYLSGAKGFDNTGPYSQAQEGIMPAERIKSGYYDFWAGGGPGGHWESGKGIECAGLVWWAYTQAYGPGTISGDPNNIDVGALHDHSFTNHTISESELIPGDLIFFNHPDSHHPVDPRTGCASELTHVAMYSGEVAGVKMLIESRSGVGVKESPMDAHPYNSCRVGFGRHSSPAVVALLIQSHSPIFLSVTDPEGFNTDESTFSQDDEEIIRGVPNELYYSVERSDEKYFGDDEVSSYKLKKGRYLIKVKPKPDTKSDDVYGLSFKTLSDSLVLAKDVLIRDIPEEGYGVDVDPGHSIASFMPVTLKVKPGNPGPSPINPKSKGVISVAVFSSRHFDATDLNPDSVRLGPGNAKPIKFQVDDANHDGIRDALLQFRTQDIGIVDSHICLEGEADGSEVHGCDLVRLVP